MSQASVREAAVLLVKVKGFVELGDNELAHINEDALLDFVLNRVAVHHDRDGASLLKMAQEARRLNYDRWYA